MRSHERGSTKESLDTLVASAARVYGFINPPIVVPRKVIARASSTAALARSALMSAVAGTIRAAPVRPGAIITDAPVLQAWGLTRGSGGSAVAFVITAGKHVMTQAFAIKAALSAALSAGLKNPAVLVSSIGDPESQRRYVRELANFFRKHGKDLPDPVQSVAAKSPHEAALLLTEMTHPLVESLPKTIDYLSEASRKVMLETLTLFESLHIPYELAPHLLHATPRNRELIFAIEGTNEKGVRAMTAFGGRFESDGQSGERVVMTGMSVSLPEVVDARDMRNQGTPTCFVIHVGEAARQKAFVLLDSLLNIHIALDQALLATSIQDQMQRAQSSGAKYLVIIGQREALDGTAIFRHSGTQLQETIPLNALISRLAHMKA